MKYRNVLLVIDYETRDKSSIDVVSRLVQSAQCEVSVVSVMKPLPKFAFFGGGLSRDEMGSMIAGAHKENIKQTVEVLQSVGAQVSGEFLKGVDFIELIRKVIRDNHDLVVVASDLYEERSTSLLGGLAKHLVRKCPCPVLLVRPGSDPNLKNILCAIDVSEDREDEEESLNKGILRTGSFLSSVYSAKQHLVQVWSVYGEGFMEARGGLDEESKLRIRLETKQEYTEAVQKLVKTELGDLAQPKLHMVRSIDISQAIVDTCGTVRADLLIMGSLCRVGLPGFLIGNTAEKIIDDIPCSLLTIKPEGFVSPIK